MAKKGNIRSIRFSDELADLIDQQIGDTFTAKFESLITKCVWELPEKEKELSRLEEQIRRRQNMLAEADSRYAKMLTIIIATHTQPGRKEAMKTTTG